jgi:signal transduction histidine kinase/CheY-like chemotaxis protein
VRPIRVYLLILVLGAILPGALLTGILVWRTFANNRTVSERRLLESARVDAAALDREFASIISTLQVLATSPTLDSSDFQAFYLEGQRVQASQSGWYSIVLLSLDGQQLVSTRVPWGSPLPFAVEPESAARVIETRQPTVGVVRSARSGPEHLFPVRVPVIRRNNLKYVLTAVVDVDALARIVPPQLPNSDEWTRSILDSNGTIAVRTRGGEDYVGGRASEEFLSRVRQSPDTVSSERTREGNPVYAAVSRATSGWIAVVVVPGAALDAPMTASMVAVLAGGALIILCGLSAVLYVSRRLSADIAAATAAAESVAQGLPVPSAHAHVAETMQLQRSLATAASLLEQRAHERDEQVRRADAARLDAEYANQTKDQFLAVLGHELRNPLAPALTVLELMKVRDPNVFTREREVLERQVAHMARLVNDLLDISRLSQGKIQLDRRRFEVSEAVERAVDMAQPLIAQRHHMLQVSVPATGLVIEGDIDRIVQVLSNLLTNAAIYTPSGGHVWLQASAVGDEVVIACEDDGPGIPDDLLPTLFDPFAQGPRALDRREGGLGLGLALARTFSQLHGGRVDFESRGPGKGSRFVVTLPLASPEMPIKAIEPAAPIVPATSQRVLLVDDNVDATEMLRIAFELAGHVVASAADGPEAIAVAAAFRPNVGVLDIGLPGMNGYELARHIRAAHPHIRLIALTGYSQTWDLEAANAAGFNAHCAKPVATMVLLDHIEGRVPLLATRT